MFCSHHIEKKHISRRLVCGFLTFLTIVSLLIPYPMVLHTEAAGKKKTIPSPVDYFGSVDKTAIGNNSKTYYFDGYKTYPKDKMQSYIKALKNAGLSGGSIGTSFNGDKTATLKDNKRETLWIGWDKSEKQVFVNILDDLTIETTKNNTTTTKPATPAKPVPSSKKNDKDGYLPDPTKFYGVWMYDDRAIGDDAWLYSCTMVSNKAAKQAVKEYFEVLQDPEYKLELIDSQVKDYTLIERGYTYQYSFRYTGSKKIKEFKDYNDQMSHVCFVLNYTNDSWGLTPSLYVSEDYKEKLIDSGKHASTRPICRLLEGNIYDEEESDDDTVTPAESKDGRPSIVAMIEECFGKCNNVKYYEEDNFTAYTYKASTYPESAVNVFLDEFKELGGKCYKDSFSASGGGKSFDVFTVGRLIYAKWYKEKKELWIRVYWNAAKNTDIFDESDFPDEPAPKPGPKPEEKECSYCRGSGKCSDCNGAGTKRKWLVGTRAYVTQDCTGCSIPGKCNYCSGRGRK